MPNPKCTYSDDIWSFEAVCDLIDCRLEASSGPDGISYTARKRCGTKRKVPNGNGVTQNENS